MPTHPVPHLINNIIVTHKCGQNITHWRGILGIRSEDCGRCFSFEAILVWVKMEPLLALLKINRCELNIRVITHRSTMDISQTARYLIIVPPPTVLFIRATTRICLPGRNCVLFFFKKLWLRNQTSAKIIRANMYVRTYVCLSVCLLCYISVRLLCLSWYYFFTISSNGNSWLFHLRIIITSLSDGNSILLHLMEIRRYFDGWEFISRSSIVNRPFSIKKVGTAG